MAEFDSPWKESLDVYRCRLLDRYNRRVVSLAVPGDEQARWRPDCYRQAVGGSRLEVYFPTVKLLDYAEGVEQLEGSDNPFAMLVLGHESVLEI